MSTFPDGGKSSLKRVVTWMSSAAGLAMVLSLSTAHAVVMPGGAAESLLPERMLSPEIGAGASNNKGAPLLDAAIKVFKRGNVERTFQLLQAAVKQEPGFPPARLMMARLFLSNGRKAEAQTFLETAATENPQHPGVYLTLGQLNFAEGHSAVALLCFEKVRSVLQGADTSKPNVRYYLAQSAAGRAAVAEQRGQWPTAEHALTVWLKVEPDNSSALHRLGRAAFFLGKREQALKYFKQASRSDPALAPPLLSMALLFQQQGDAAQAEALMEQAVQANPDSPRVRFRYGRWLLESGRTDEAVRQGQTTLKLDPDYTPGKVLLGHAALASGRWQEAEKWFRAVHSVSPGDPASANFLALALLRQADPAKQQEALQVAQTNARQFSNVPEVMATLGWINYRLGNKQDAEAALQRASADHKLASDTAYYLAHLRADRGQREDAIVLLKSAIKAPGRFGYRDEAMKMLERLRRQ